MMVGNSTCGLPTWTSEWKRQYEGEPGNFPSGDPGNRMQVPSEHYRRLQRWSPSSGTLEVARRRPVVPTGTSRTRVRREIAIVVAVRKYIDQNANIWRPLQQRHLCRFGFDLSLENKKGSNFNSRFLLPFESILVPSESSADFSGSIGVYPDAPDPATGAAAGWATVPSC